ncbi:ABC transporter permease [Allorhodopirellula solitaria]|uniref:Transport permease protein n=1 Tax=Allorhodopirellula solitaria TaxID=2527987 RepID=A0A5C5X131_9BACT|nr:ABC transporter permease [Allorhodopirellula solitaria]TWT55865.1 Teichoic acid translocation permease protein TagG [Allorhodopirellula solitaria]
MSTIADTTESVAAGASRPAGSEPEHVTIIEARKGLQLFDWKELVAYRDLFRFLIWRQIKVRYAQSAIGIGWAVIQPLFSMVLFTIVFGRLAKIDSDGVPYALFSLAALLPWTYFSNAISDGVASLVSEANMLRKIYFPRLLLPLSAVVAKLVDFGIAAVMMVLLMIYYQHLPGPEILILPLLIVLMVVTASGVSVWLTALAVQYRDVKHAMTFLIQLGMYASPVVYPTSLIPEKFQLLYALNPMVGVIEGYRSALLGSQPIPWSLLAVGTASASVLMLTGLAFFRSKEKVFADVA